ncbi:hypothetical protein K438DRAFT_2110717 [Mycena galopus ATCC 62051]|nr:hypothetical protein K438DRAFT_2110717 [Mycena galopus ATCC 62051]
MSATRRSDRGSVKKCDPVTAIGATRRPGQGSVKKCDPITAIGATRHPGRVVIRFPPGSTILLPSAIIRHSNVPVGAHETRSSFVQYTAGGIFRWIRNGFMTDDDFELQASSAEKAARAAEAETRWEEGLKMFSTIDEL